MRKSIWFVLLALLALALPAFAQSNQPTVAELLQNDDQGRFTTLLAAIDALGMTDTLGSLENATILAPTNEAFNAALAYLGLSADELLADPALLGQVLQYHIIPQQLLLTDLTAGPEVATLGGDTVQFDLTDGVLTVNGITISDIDNVAANRVVVDALDGVLLPPAIAEAAAANQANVRVVHLSPDAGAVDVYANGALTDLQGVTFGAVSDWMQIPAGAQSFALAAAGDEPGGASLKRIEPGTWVTVVAAGTAATDDLSLYYLVENQEPVAQGYGRLSVFHGLQFAGPVDVYVDGVPVITYLAFPGTAGDNDGFATRVLPAGTYPLEITAAGDPDTVVYSGTVVIGEGTNTLLAIGGTPTNPSVIASSTPLPAAS